MSIYTTYTILGLVMIPGIILGIIASTRVNKIFNKYKSESTRGRKACEVARTMLHNGDCTNTEIRKISGHLTDNYNPNSNIVSLSESTFDSASISAIGVACHEVGHALQHKEKYFPVRVRSALVPVLNAFTKISWPLLFVGLALEIIYYTTWSKWLIYIAVGIYALETLFCLVTLPVELNASKRAYNSLVETNELTEEEAKKAKKVLNAAALTYVAALITSILSLLRVILLIVNIRKK